METFQPEGGEKKNWGGWGGGRNGRKAEQCSDTDCLTDDCSQTKAGDVSSAGGAGVGLVSLAFSWLSACLTPPEPVPTERHGGRSSQTRYRRSSSPLLNSEFDIFLGHSLSLSLSLHC